MAQLYAACDIVALPSLNEAFGNVVLEGMAATRPVVATRVGGPEEIVVDGVSGMLVPPADAQALGAALNRLIAEPQTARRMAIAGRRRAVECFSMERFAERWSRLYAELLPGQGDRRSHRSRRSANTAPVQSPTPMIRLNAGIHARAWESPMTTTVWSPSPCGQSLRTFCS